MPGVVTDPIVLIDEAPVPMVELPVEVRVVKAPVPPEIETNVAAPAFETLQVEEVPKISLPVPEFDMAKTAPVAEAYDWVRDKIFAESVQVPAVWVQLEENVARGPEMVNAPPVLVVRARDRSRRFPESATVVT